MATATTRHSLTPTPFSSPLPSTSPTPRRNRRTRPSFSPASLKATVPSADERGDTTGKGIDHSIYTSEAEQKTHPTSTLEFADSSFVGDDGSIHLRNMKPTDREILHERLAEVFGVAVVTYSVPFMVLGCEGPVPDEETRPVFIGGLVAIWKPLEDMEFDPFLGEPGNAEYVVVDEEMASRIEMRKSLPVDVVLYLAQEIFPDCEAISMMWNSLVVELPKCSENDFALRLGSLPMGIQGAKANLLFHNGPLPNTETRSRAVQRKTAHLDSLVTDETDYVRMDGTFYPGSMLSSLDSKGECWSHVSAGILVKRGEKRRLTCSYHNWEDQDRQHQGILGQSDQKGQRIFRAAQGIHRGKPGTDVGFLRGRIEDTDIGLLQLKTGIRFENQFMDIPARPKIFVPLDEQTPGDYCVLDSHVTGRQEVMTYGQRFPIQRKRRSTAHPSLFAPEGQHHTLPPDNVAYVTLKQGVYATNAITMTGKPQIRASVCGSVIVRSHSVENPDIKKDEMLELGQVCGMMHFADLQELYPTARAGNFLLYADSFDPLIAAGWAIDHGDDGPEKGGKGEDGGTKVNEGDDGVEGKRRGGNSGDKLNDGQRVTKKQRTS